jgi:hypothetical protein
MTEGMQAEVTAQGEPRTGTSGSEHHTLEEMLDRIEEATAGEDATSLGDVLDAIGSRSFGPLLLLAGLVMVAPLVGDIPGVPSLMGAIVLVTAGQLLLGRDHFWLPRFLLDRSVRSATARKGLRWARPAARFLDRWSRPRLQPLVQGAGNTLIALLCIAVSVATPLMEVVPFSANFAGLVILLCGLAVIVRDGLLTLVALGTTAVLVALVVMGLG